MASSLTQRIEQATRTRRLWIDREAFPFPTFNCCCGSSIDLDYGQGDREMNNRLSAWFSEHSTCARQQEQEHRV